MLRKRKFEPALPAPWLMIFSDLMTLLLTFFVILVAMSVFDEQNVQNTISSVYGAFGSRAGEQPRYSQNEPPLFGGEQDSGEQALLQEIKQALFTDGKEVRLRQNRQVIEFSLGSDLLFEAGSTRLNAKGKDTLNILVPYLKSMEYPLKISGHSASRAEEEGIAFEPAGLFYVDSTWRLSLERALAVYLYYLEAGVHPAMLEMEGCGEYQPAYSNESIDGRRSNRRVELIFDKRNSGLKQIIEQVRDSNAPERGFYFKDFFFDLEYPEQLMENLRREREGRLGEPNVSTGRTGSTADTVNSSSAANPGGSASAVGAGRLPNTRNNTAGERMGGVAQ